MAGFCGSVRLKNLPHDHGFSRSGFDFRSNERLAIDKTPLSFSRWYFNFKAKDYLSLHRRLSNVGS
jgi:hypothetical protein